MKTSKLNDFTYVRTRFSGLTTTKIFFQETLFELRKEFFCGCCKQNTEIIVEKPGVTSKNQTKFFNECVSESLCPCCFTDTDRAIEGAAENLIALLN